MQYNVIMYYHVFICRCMVQLRPTQLWDIVNIIVFVFAILQFQLLIEFTI